MGFLATAVALLALQTAAQPVKASIEGVVVRARTSEVIPRVRITTFRSAQPSGPVPTVVSDDQGRFIIKDLDAGWYSLSAERNGFARQAYGERRPGVGGVPLAVRTGERLKDVVFQTYSSWSNRWSRS
jgi:Carboxypeptidase regulatory-like domain